MQALHPTLAGFSDPGVHTGNVAKKLILKRNVRGTVPVLEGRQIHQFHCDEPLKWLKVGYRAGPGEYFRISPASAYSGVDIILRQTADRPIAARHIHRCHFRNSVLALKIPDGFSVEYVLGVLNSEAACLIYRALAFESRQRAFPQVKVGRLKMVPLPDPTIPGRSAQVREIERIVCLLEPKSISDRGRDPLLRELNRIVWNLYGLRGRPDTQAAVRTSG
jgi:hypothetical protein